MLCLNGTVDLNTNLPILIDSYVELLMYLIAALGSVHEKFDVWTGPKIMEKALKIAWINRIQDESQASWKIIPIQFFHKHCGVSFLTKCNFALDLDDKLPKFYKAVLDYW